MDIAIGTAQFGLDYGISNTMGKTQQKSACDILSAANKSGINCLDTATLYGDAEQVIGQCIQSSDDWRIITKTEKVQTDTVDNDALNYIKASVEQSEALLSPAKIDTLLLHRCDDLFLPQGERLYQYLSGLKFDGVVDKIGVSIYSEEQIDQLLSNYTIDVVQLPLNLFDQRLVMSGHLSRLKQAGVEIHVRSVFLQGLLLMPMQDIPDYFNPILPIIQSYHRAIVDHQLTPLSAALSYVAHVPEVDVAVVGVNTVEQLNGIIQAKESTSSALPFEQFAVNDPRYVNPAEWRL